MKVRQIIASTAFVAAFALPTAFAQSPAPSGDRPTIAQRKENQQDRIAQGVKSGQLTAGETSRLEHHESQLNHEIARDRRADGGKLTGGERHQINHQQNRLSRQIYRDKHNGIRQH